MEYCNCAALLHVQKKSIVIWNLVNFMQYIPLNKFILLYKKNYATSIVLWYTWTNIS